MSIKESDCTITKVLSWSQYFPPLLRTFSKALVEYPDYHLHLF